MATLEDLEDVLVSVRDYSMKQANLLSDMVDMIQKDAEERKRKEEQGDADRTRPNDSDRDRDRPDERVELDNDSKLGLLGLLGLFGTNILSKFAVIAASATAFAVSLATTIGVLSGQTKVISTFFPKWSKGITQSFTYVSTSIKNIFTSGVNKISTMFNGIISMFNGAFGQGSSTSALGRSLNSMKTYIGTIAKTFTDAAKTLGELVKGGSSLVETPKLFSKIGGLLKTFGQTVAHLSKVIGKIFAPIAVIITAFETVTGAIQGYADGGILGALKGGIDGFFTSLVTVPLDFVKSLVSWVIGKFGWDEGAAFLNSFSFTDLFTSLTDSIYNWLNGAIDWVKNVFADPVPLLKDLWNSIVGAGGLLDLIWWPTNQAITYIQKKFGWKDEDAPDFNLLEYIKNAFSKISTIVTSTFDSMIEWMSTMPEKLKLIASDKWNDISEKVSLGFVDMGEWLSSIPDKLEAIFKSVLSSVRFTIPEWVPSIGGKIISLVDEATVEAANKAALEVDPKYEDQRAKIISASENRRREIELEMSKLNEAATANNAQPQPVVINAPDQRVIQTTNSGGNVSSVLTSFGTSRSDLDFASRPSMAQ